MAEVKSTSTHSFERSTPLDASQCKPTPTQEENDLAAVGEYVMNKEPDGSPPDPGVEAAKELEKKQEEKRKSMHAEHSGRAGYQTRQHTPAQHTAPKAS